MMSRGVALFGQISEINDHLYLSGAGVLKPDSLRKKRINLIVNVTTEEPAIYINGVDYLKIRIDDDPNSRLDSYFDLVADRIKANRDRGGRTLVHCVAGVSRSATLCIVYLMKHQRMSLRQSYLYVKGIRSIIRPNIGFWKQMMDYEKRTIGTNSVQFVSAPNGATDVDGRQLLIPDVYANELRRQMLFSSSPAPPSSSSSSPSPKWLSPIPTTNHTSAVDQRTKSQPNLPSTEKNGHLGLPLVPFNRSLYNVANGTSLSSSSHHGSAARDGTSPAHSSSTSKRLTASARLAASATPRRNGGQMPTHSTISRLVLVSGVSQGSALKPKTKNKLFSDFSSRQDFLFPTF